MPNNKKEVVRHTKTAIHRESYKKTFLLSGMIAIAPSFFVHAVIDGKKDGEPASNLAIGVFIVSWIVLYYLLKRISSKLPPDSNWRLFID